MILRVKIGPGKYFIRMPRGGAIYDLDTGVLHYFDEYGARIFEGVCTDFFEALDELCKDRDRRECIRNIVEFLKEPSRKGYVVLFTVFSRRKAREIGKCVYSSWFIPSLIDVQITSRCNANCPYCYIERKNKDLDPDILDVFLKKLTDLGETRIKIPLIVLRGGEPLIHSRFQDFIIIALRYSSKTVIVTNGLELGKYIDYIAMYKDKVYVRVMLDSIDKEIYSKLKGVEQEALRKVLDNIGELISRGMNAEVIIPVTKYNIDNIPSTIKTLRELYGDKMEISVEPVLRIFNASGEYAIGPDDIKILSTIKKYYEELGEPFDKRVLNNIREEARIDNCGAGWLRIYIDSEGYVKPCRFMPDTMRLGRIDEKDIGRLLGEGKPLIYSMLSPPNPDGLCKDCPYTGWCEDCPARALWLYRAGNVDCKWMIVEGHRIEEYNH